jgi:hypothetical protein
MSTEHPAFFQMRLPTNSFLIGKTGISAQLEFRRRSEIVRY